MSDHKSIIINFALHSSLTYSFKIFIVKYIITVFISGFIIKTVN